MHPLPFPVDPSLWTQSGSCAEQSQTVVWFWCIWPLPPLLDLIFPREKLWKFDGHNGTNLWFLQLFFSVLLSDKLWFMLMLMLMYNSVFALEEEWQQENKTNSNWKSALRTFADNIYFIVLYFLFPRANVATCSEFRGKSPKTNWKAINPISGFNCSQTFNVSNVSCSATTFDFSAIYMQSQIGFLVFGFFVFLFSFLFA